MITSIRVPNVLTVARSPTCLVRTKSSLSHFRLFLPCDQAPTTTAKYSQLLNYNRKLSVAWTNRRGQLSSKELFPEGFQCKGVGFLAVVFGE
jgi:hypothetical protein